MAYRFKGANAGATAPNAYRRRAQACFRNCGRAELVLEVRAALFQRSDLSNLQSYDLAQRRPAYSSGLQRASVPPR